MPKNRGLWESRGAEEEDPKGCFPLLLGLNPKQLVLPACLIDFPYTNQLCHTPKEIVLNKCTAQDCVCVYIPCHPVPLMANMSYRTMQIVVYNTRDPMLQMQGFQADIMLKLVLLESIVGYTVPGCGHMFHPTAYSSHLTPRS